MTSCSNEPVMNPKSSDDGGLVPRQKATIQDMPSEMLEEVVNYLDDIHDAVSFGKTSQRLRAWWLANRCRHAVYLTKRVIPDNVWAMSVLWQKIVPNSLSISEYEETLDAVRILSPLVSQRRETDYIQLTDNDLLSMARRHLEITLEPWTSKSGHAQLHEAASILVPESGGELDDPQVVQHFLPVHYAMHMAEKLTTSTTGRPDCRYWNRPNWYIELAVGVMVDLKPSGWWDGLAWNGKEPEVKDSLGMFFGAQVVTSDPNGPWDYLT